MLQNRKILWLFVAVLPVMCWGGTDKGNLLAKGLFVLSAADSRNHDRYMYEYSKDVQSHQERLVISTLNGEPELVYYLEVGQEFFGKAFQISVGKRGARFLCVALAWGASSSKTVVFGLGGDGRLQELFSSVSRHGARILDVDGDGYPEVVIGDIKYPEKKNIMLVYDHDPVSGGFFLECEYSVLIPHSYRISEDGIN